MKKRQRLLALVDTWQFWSMVTNIALAAVVVWLLVLNAKVNRTVDAVAVTAKANTNAIAYLCQTNGIVEALTNQTIFLLQSEQLHPPKSIPRQITISVFSGYAEVLRDTEPCVKAERKALR